MSRPPRRTTLWREALRLLGELLLAGAGVVSLIALGLAGPLLVGAAVIGVGAFALNRLRRAH